MERSVWTDERIDDLVGRIDTQFGLLRNEMAEMRTETREEMREIRGAVHDLRRDMFHGAIAIFGSQVAILAVLLAQAL